MFAKVFKAFQYREFRLLWLGACTSSIGTWMQQLAQSWLVYKISGSSFYLGLDAFLGQIPILLFSLLGGVVADRHDRRAILIISQLVQLTCAFTLAALFAFTEVHVWEILILSFIVGLAQAFGGPAYQALIPSLVDAKDMPNAIALNSIQFNLARVVGPVLGGLALQKLGASWCFSLNGISYIAVILSLLSLKRRDSTVKRGTPVLDSLYEGFSFIRRQDGMYSLITLAFCMTLLGVPVLTFLPVYAKDIFNMGPNLFTMFLCFSGAGSVCGALLVAGWGDKQKKGLVALTVLILLGGLIAGFALSKNILLSSFLIFLTGAAIITVFASVNSLVQLLTSNEMRGRVMSIYNLAFRGGMPLGSLAAGAMMKVYPAPWVLAFNGFLMVLLGLYFLLVQRRMRSL